MSASFVLQQDHSTSSSLSAGLDQHQDPFHAAMKAINSASSSSSAAAAAAAAATSDNECIRNLVASNEQQMAAAATNNDSLAQEIVKSFTASSAPSSSILDGFQAALSSAAQPVKQTIQQVSSGIESTKTYYNWANSFADPRVKDWPLMSNVGLMYGIFFAYLFMANYGPTLMKARKPMQLRWQLIVYNLYIALLNLWIACEICYCSYKLRYSSLCILVNVSNDPYALRIANAVWWYYISKAIEFTDTLFFVLRKKDKQLTFLHKYHHSSMFLVWWTAAKFVPGGSSIYPVVINSLVHVLMYTYYGLSALGPSVQKYLWWKIYLTQIQLVQFFIGVAILASLIVSGCQFTRWMLYVLFGYVCSFIVLFGNFYLHEYINKKRQIKKQKEV